MKYTKPPISLEEQVRLLKARGLKFQDLDRARHYLSNISYYRLRAYTYPFQDNIGPEHRFIKDVTFEEIIQLYVFDRRLRLLVFDGLEKIEIALRTKIIYEFALVGGSHWHDKCELFKSKFRFEKDISKLNEEVNRSSETFIKHYKERYSKPENPPSWMSLEVASLGLLSKIFENLKKSSTKKQIVNEFGLKNHMFLESWMHAFAQLRNICAHHGRLWNRRFTSIPKLPEDTLYPFVINKRVHANKLYAQLICMLYILHIISPGHQFIERLKHLVSNCPQVDLREMGFPEGWENEPIWQSSNTLNIID
jgi:abortive infection bacteriophage resistance protein